MILAFTLGIIGGRGTATTHADPASQSSPTLAGLVVRFGDGSTRELCVDLGGAERTGMELLRMSGLPVISDDGPLGSMVCRIGGEGCDFPAERCDCECQDLSNCTYWAYYTLKDGRWDYATIGPAARTVRHGDVDGWAWGRGTVSSGALPPQRSFEAVCAAALAPTATIPAPPTPRATPTRPAPTPTPRRTATRAPTAEPRAGASPRSSATARASGTPRATATGLASVTSDDSAIGTGTFDDVDADRQATLASLPTALAAFATTQAEVVATLQAQGASGMGKAGGPQESRMVPTSAPAVRPTKAVTLVAARALSPEVDASGDAISSSAGAAAGDAGRGGESGFGYLIVVLVLALLGGVWVWLRR